METSSRWEVETASTCLAKLVHDQEVTRCKLAHDQEFDSRRKSKNKNSVDEI